MKKIEVYEKDQLKKAVDEGYDEIQVHGDLAEKVMRSYKIKKYSKFAIAALGVAIGTIPFTGGTSTIIAAPVAAAIAAVTGVEIAVIVAIVFLGLALVLALTNNYDLDLAIELGGNTGDKEGNGKKAPIAIRLTKKKHNKVEANSSTENQNL